MKTTTEDLRRDYYARRTWLKRRLREEGMKKSELARAVGVAPSTITNIIGGREPGFLLWLDIIEALDTEAPPVAVRLIRTEVN